MSSEMASSLLRTESINASAAISASSIPSAIAFNSFSPSSFSHSFGSSKTQFLSLTSPTRVPRHFNLVKSFAHPPSALHMESLASRQDKGILPELLTEFMVDMKCEGCVSAVDNKLQTLEGVKKIETDLTNQVVRVLGTSPVKELAQALEQTGRNARLIGQGVPEDFLISAAVAEFKGPDVFGVVRFAQVNMELARIEANFSGLVTGTHGWSINEFGDLTRGAASTGKIFNPMNKLTVEQLCGDLGTLEVDEKGEALYSGVKENLRVADLIGRSVVLYQTEDKSAAGIEAAVIARSAGVGENYKKLCTCDGTIIWESSSNDFVTSKV